MSVVGKNVYFCWCGMLIKMVVVRVIVCDGDVVGKMVML